MELLAHANEMFGQFNQTNHVLLNDCSDLKSTALTGKSFHTFTTLMPGVSC